MRRLGLTILTALFFTSHSPAQTGGLSRAHSELVEAERAFAKFCVEQGQPEAWLAFFADDGIIFQPGPVNAKEFMRKQPPTPKPPPVTLNWEPIYGDISRAGDFGYNLGAWKITDHTEQKRPDLYGYFFSVWKRQPAGGWKVVLDFGISVTSPTADHSLGRPFSPAARPRAKLLRAGDAAQETTKLTDLDAALTGGAKPGRGALDSYLGRIHPDARVLRFGLPPAVGGGAARSFLSGKGVELRLAPAGSDQSASGELGYTFGSYEIREGGRAREQGHYAHMWKRDESGRWRIVVANFRPNPPSD